MANKSKYFKKDYLALGNQVIAMEKLFPSFEVSWKKNTAIWTGNLTPTEISATYTVQVSYSLAMTQPCVKVQSPQLTKRGEENIPHVYPGLKLCLFRPRKKEWSKNMYIAETIIPWTSLWLYYYELWHATGEWLGGGEHFEPIKKRGKINEESVNH
ncbi:hypothetical protein K7887_22810 (plasmid) [Sutcliffiella horikoshii]|uniref:hypothetical protein n=1 Tax=Sutcliffiella horikoshii TaxID=79883 RepID=UPI001CBDB9C4|nr:hypothetical protein [Sutcliffiella horikoshii]UAL49800.1 hypothetical protein K7887_22810 [Sutcliffiella horikoshii]